MAYPNQIDRFSEKLNKKQEGSMYAIEEKLQITGGVYEGLLVHGNIANNSIRVHTGPKFTGEEVTNFIVSIPVDTPWKRWIKIFTNASTVYVTYETPGDTVEADDINRLQNSIMAVQEEVERYKASGVIDGGCFLKTE